MSKENEKKWDELARNGVLCSQPKLELSPEEAKQYINRHGFHEESLEGKISYALHLAVDNKALPLLC